MAGSLTETRAVGTPARAGRREWTGLAIIALPCMVYAMDMTVLNLALPAISVDLRPSAGQLLWIVDVYGFMVAAFLITMGTLGDRIGRRRLLLIGAAAFGAASCLAAFARSAEMLIAMRALLGIAGATLAPSTMSLIRNMFHDAHQRQMAIGIWIASFSLGATIGPFVGGLLLQYFWWGSVFLVAAPVMALLLLLGPGLLPEFRDLQAGRIDLGSVALSLAAVLLSVWGLKQMAEHGVGALPAAGLLAGLMFGGVFLRRQRQLPYPLLDPGLFRRPGFAAAIAAYGLSCLAMFGVYIHIAQYLQAVLGLSPLAAGLLTMPWALAFVAGSLAAPWLARRVPAATILVRGLQLAATGFVLLVWPGRGGAGMALLMAGMVLMSLGMAPVFAVGNQIIISAAPPQRAGAASALAETSSEFSGALGVALFGSLGTVVYRLALADAMPAGVGAAGQQAALATIGAAIEAARQLPEPAGTALAEAAKAAFGRSLQATAIGGAAVVWAASVMAGRLLRRDALAAPAAQPAECLER